MTVTRALWAACALSVTTTASANEGLVAKFQDAPGGIWKVCSPAWAFPQLDDTDSVVVMPPPTMETWVLEGSLEPFVHYVPVQRDWSDLEARLAWAEAHPAAAANISANARAHVLKTLGASAASERRVVMAVLRGYRQALACAQSA